MLEFAFFLVVDFGLRIMYYVILFILFFLIRIFGFGVFGLLDFWNLEFGFWILDVGEPAQIGRGNRPAALGEPLGRATRTHSFIEKVRTPSGKPGWGKSIKNK